MQGVSADTTIKKGSLEFTISKNSSTELGGLKVQISPFSVIQT